MSSNNTHKQGQWAKWTGAAVAALLVALLFRGCNDWGQTVQAPKIDPAVVNKIDAPAVPVANKLMQLAGFNNNGKFTLNGTVPTDAIKAQIDAELKKTFGDGNYVNNLAVAADVKPAGWLAKLAGLFDFFKVSGAEVTFNGDAVTLSGTTGSLSEKLQTFLGDSIKVSALDIANASKAATGNALDTLNALKPDASGKEILDALNLQIINFASGSAVIPAENQAVLKKAATLLKDKKDFTFEIGGHADNVGNEAANLTLSEKRAAAVRDFLVKNGVADTMLTAKGYGSSIPVADNATEAGRFKNRRIEYR
ncbi:OmpA family protein [Formosimonas limnophila]|nr:OmpA family protein [Formosimonas limnophila]